MSVITDQEITHLLNERVITEPLRPYLGLSMVGSCHRYLQYYHYWAFKSSYTARIQRLFNVGHDSERVMIRALESAGIMVSGEQHYVVGSAGHWQGHIDGIGTSAGGCFLIEFKTHNEANFKKLKKTKMRTGFPKHYAQVQSYMGYKSLEKCLYVALNKNDSTLYFEWIEFDPEYFEESKRKEMEVIASDALLPRIGNNTRSWFECKMCEARDVCFETVKPERSCRTCINVNVEEDGDWSCGLDGGGFLEIPAQRKGCDQYQITTMFWRVENDRR